MSDTLAPTDPNALLFPAFVYGDHAVCRRKMRAEAKKWAKRVDDGKDFPEPKLIPVPPGSLMICAQVEADIIAFGAGAHNPRWFFYLVDYLRVETLGKSSLSRAVFQPQFEAFACRYPWGALSVAMSGGIASVDRVARRLEAVLSFWEQLDTLRYRRIRQMTLADLMFVFYEGTIRMWVDAPAGSVKDALRVVSAQMRTASEDEIHTRMIRHLHEVADTDPNLKHREWLQSPGLIEAEVLRTKETNPERYQSLSTALEVPQYLRKLEEKYPIK
ncbi:MAG TPA: hypothetical protein PK156_01255 [Polyangium sp.]|nr:hypothetical protein [Polyangium sp.]